VLQIIPIPAFDDNYIWLLRGAGADVVAVVDPGDEEPVLEYLQREQLRLGSILLTHKHGDHTGGVRELLAAYPGARVFAPANEKIQVVAQLVRDGDELQLEGLDLRLRVMEVPGHTEGHLAYLGDGFLFCGDTLFTCGCGRVFSGTHEQLYASLQRIAELPPETRIYCAHEYTLDNIGFGKWVEPDNPALLQREREAIETRKRGEPTVPSTLQLELDTNPFLRSGQPAVIAAAQRYAGSELSSGAEVFTAIRKWKDREYD
jgi:hydroxyacylglutathione hydrolase